MVSKKILHEIQLNFLSLLGFFFAETTSIMSYFFESFWTNGETVNNKNKMRRLFTKINFRELKHKRKVFCVQLNSCQYYLFKSNK
jgi:hypothetical protein